MPLRTGRAPAGPGPRRRESYTRPPLTASEPPTRRRAALRRQALVTLLAVCLLVAAVAARDLVPRTTPQDPGLSTPTPEGQSPQSGPEPPPVP